MLYIKHIWHISIWTLSFCACCLVDIYTLLQLKVNITLTVHHIQHLNNVGLQYDTIFKVQNAKHWHMLAKYSQYSVTNISCVSFGQKDSVTWWPISLSHWQVLVAGHIRCLRYSVGDGEGEGAFKQLSTENGWYTSEKSICIPVLIEVGWLVSYLYVMNTIG